MRSSIRHWLMAEIVVCFLPNAAMLFAGAVILPSIVVSVFRGTSSWEGAALHALLVVCGSLGFFALFSVVSRLFDGRERIERPVLILVGVLAGVAPLLFQVVSALSRAQEPTAFAVMVVLPLLATGHILFLSRKLFVASCRRGQ